MTPTQVIQFMKDESIQVVDLKFVDLPGLWQHFSVSAQEFAEAAFTEGVGFDGSSIRGFQDINESDMLLFPDSGTAFIDPFTNVKTLSLICDVRDPVDGSEYTRDPRHIARKAEAYLKSRGIADKAYFGPEAEFYILDSVRFDQSYNFGYYHIDSEEGFWNSGKEGENGNKNLGYKTRYKEGYFPVPPTEPAGYSFRDDVDPRESGRTGGSAPSRGGHGRSDGDRSSVRHSDPDGRQHVEVQVCD